MVQHRHRDRGHHGDLLVVVFEDKHHVEVLEAELYPLEVHELYVLECADEGGPGGEVDEAAGGRLQQYGLTVRYTLQYTVQVIKKVNSAVHKISTQYRFYNNK